jgi:hypothetical protein
MSRKAKSLTFVAIAVVVFVVLAWGGGQWLWHKLLVMHGMAK